MGYSIQEYQKINSVLEERKAKIKKDMESIKQKEETPLRNEAYKELQIRLCEIIDIQNDLLLNCD